MYKIVMDAPKPEPVVVGTRVEFGIAGYAAAGEGVVLPAGNQAGAHRVLHDVVGDGVEGIAFALVFAEDVVVSLLLPSRRDEVRREVLAEKLDREALVRGSGRADPQQMHVIRHQRVAGASQMIAGASVQEDVLPGVMKGGREPAGGATFERKRPMDEGVAAIVLAGEAREVALG